jgi:hypothetical protein
VARVERGKFYISGKPVAEGRGGGAGSWIVFFTSLVVFTFSLTCVYHAMRGVMDLGGFVAYGGPYHIAHEAPGWVWIFPVSIFMMIISVFVSLGTATKTSGPNLMSLSWSALFTALGWNFVEYGFGVGRGWSIAWGWAICAVIFMLMGLVPLFVIVGSFARSLGERRTEEHGTYPGAPGVGMSWGASLLLQFAMAAAGVVLGILFFRAIS